MSPISLAQFRDRRPAVDPAPRPRHIRGQGLFLRGPVPMAWLHVAGAIPGKALAVGVELWHWAGRMKSTRVKLNLSRFADRGISRFSAARGLAALERAGLVRCARGSGRTPVVTLLDAPPERRPEP